MDAHVLSHCPPALRYQTFLGSNCLFVMCLFQVLALLGTTIVMKMHFSKHVPRGGPSILLSPTQEVIYKYPGSSYSPSGPVLPALLLLCSHAVLQLWHRGVHRGQGTTKYTVSWSLRIPEGWLCTSVCAGPCLREEDSPASMSLSGIQSGETLFGTSWHQSTFRMPWRPPSPSLPLA